MYYQGLSAEAELKPEPPFSYHGFAQHGWLDVAVSFLLHTGSATRVRTTKHEAPIEVER